MIIEIDHKIRIAQSELPPLVYDSIKEALEIPNITRIKAMEQNIWGWSDMPETIALHSDVNGYLEMPRGFYDDLIRGLGFFELEYEIIDRRSNEKTLEAGEPIALHPWQAPAVEAILKHREGIWKAPAASGKTVGVLEAIRRSKTRSIVLVNTKDILWQWIDRTKQHLGEDFPVGQIGDNIFDIDSTHLTVATVQTLHSRYDALESAGFFDSFGFMCLDECHHATADTYNRLVSRFSSLYRIGVSATPDKTGDFALAVNVLGPIFHTTKRKDVSNLIMPDVFRIPTDFNFPYVGARGRRPSNYGKMISELVEDEHRNALIVKSIMVEEGSHSLVVSKRLGHLDTIMEKLQDAGYEDEILLLTGQESSEDRQRVVEIASESPCVVLSTLADEALDISRLDRIFLVFPQRNPGLIEQQVGRICRSHPDKEDAKIFDFHDWKVGPLDAQWRNRRLRVYQPHGYSIMTVLPKNVFSYEKS